MKKENKPLLSLLKGGASFVFVSLLLVLSIVAFGSMNKSVAWFSQNESVSGKGMSVSVEKPLEITASLVSYPVTAISSDGVYTIYSTKESYELPLRDPNNISFSEFEKALVVIIQLSCDENISVDVSAETIHEDISQEAENYVSNCIKITPALLNNDQTTAKLNGSPTSFITKNGDAWEKTDSLVFCSLDLVAGESQTICLVMEYNEEYLNAFGEYLLEQKDLTITQIDYSNDIEFHITPK
jgi:hypothetical protein